MGRTDLVDELEERIQIVQPPDALVQRVHHLVRVLLQLLGRGLLLLRLQLLEFGEHVQQVRMLLEQSGIRNEGEERGGKGVKNREYEYRGRGVSKQVPKRICEYFISTERVYI